MMSKYRRIAFRVGVNIGDVIVEPHDIFGDGVNIAARLESIAEPGGICISSSAYDHVQDKVGVEFADLGEQNLKNIDRRVRVYAVISDGPRSAAQAERTGRSPLSPPRLSIVVLPFANLSGNPEQRLFRRWCDRKPHLGLVTHHRFIRHRPTYCIHLQRQGR
jgi:hypothetical protein